MSATLTPFAVRRAGSSAGWRAGDQTPWSTRRVAAFVIVVCGLFWLTVGALIAWAFGVF